MTLIDRIQKRDEEISARLVLQKEEGPAHRLVALIGHSCDSWYWLIGLTLVWVFTRGPVRTAAILWALSLAALAVFVLGIKFLLRRPRPEGEWGSIYRVTDPHSFPSGHAARAMTIAFLALQFQNPLWFIGLFVWAILVGYSRVALRLHYFSDILVGWLIGALSGILALKFLPSLILKLPEIFPFLT
ncbi:MAG TPA: phosphatase PAP2 family protein [Anaerolineaceae bacterium]|nr:phosphatase PAP2 family protein [Anaerolineaceae bacterium]